MLYILERSVGRGRARRRKLCVLVNVGGMGGIIWGLEECLGGKEGASVKIHEILTQDTGEGGTGETFSPFLIKRLQKTGPTKRPASCHLERETLCSAFSPFPRAHRGAGSRMGGNRRLEETVFVFWCSPDCDLHGLMKRPLLKWWSLSSAFCLLLRALFFNVTYSLTSNIVFVFLSLCIWVACVCLERSGFI